MAEGEDLGWEGVFRVMAITDMAILAHLRDLAGSPRINAKTHRVEKRMIVDLETGAITYPI